MKRLGNYRWVICPNCGEKYTTVDGVKKSKHVCKDKNGNKLV